MRQPDRRRVPFLERVQENSAQDVRGADNLIREEHRGLVHV